MKLKEKNIFIITIVFTLVVLGIMVGYNFTSFHTSSIDNMEVIGKNSLTAKINELDSYVSQSSNALRVVSDNLNFMLSQNDSIEQIEQYLKFETDKFQTDIDENFTGVYGYIDGKYVDGSDWVPDADYVPTERDWYVNAVQANGDLVTIEPYVDAETGSVIVSVCRLLSDGKSVISLDVKLDRVQEINETIKLNGMGYGFIVSNDGMVIAHSRDVTEIGKNYISGEDISPDIKSLLAQAQESDYFYTKLSGEKDYVFTGEVTDIWKVVLVIPSSEFLKSVHAMLVRNSIIMIIVYAVIIFFSVVSYRKMVQSIEELDEKQRQVDDVNKSYERSKDVINKIAYKNILTDLKNRYSFESDIDKMLATEQFDVAYFDIDNFRNINEVYGYSFGDNLLISISQKLMEQFNQCAEIYNIFGNEFCIVFNQSISYGQAVDCTTQAFNIISDTYLIGNLEIKVNVSGALHHYRPKECPDTNSLLSILNSLVKEVKMNGGNNCIINQK